jgi:hypothetical protein
MADVAVEPLQPTFDKAAAAAVVETPSPELPRGVVYGALGALIAIELGWLLTMAVLLAHVL